MPFILFIVCFAGAIMLFRSDIGEADRRREADLAKTTAAQMVWYHNAAVRMCVPPSACAPGEVAVSETALNPDGVMARRLVALTDGRWVVTTWRNAPRNGRGEPKQAAVALELKRLSRNSLMVGMFDAGTCQINASRGMSLYREVVNDGRTVMLPDETATGNAVSTLSSVIGGVSLRHGAAVMATRVGDAAAGACTAAGS